MRESLRERLQAKLRSGRGASITFALLLFLVCAVVGSVVLAAGTAASGRVSQLAEADRRYYAVTSAAQLLKEKIQAEEVTIKRTMTVSGKVYTTDWILETDEGISYCTTSSTVDSPEYGFVPPVTSVEFLKNAAYYYVFGTDAAGTVNESVAETLWNLARNAESIPPSIPAMTMNLFSGDAGETAVDGAVPVSVETTVEKNGNLSIKLTAGEEGEAYLVRLDFTVGYERRYDDDPAAPVSDTPPGGDWQVTGTTSEPFSVTAEKTDVIRWEFKSMTKGS